jgi:hypothetical protein
MYYSFLQISAVVLAISQAFQYLIDAASCLPQYQFGAVDSHYCQITPTQVRDRKLAAAVHGQLEQSNKYTLSTQSDDTCYIL